MPVKEMQHNINSTGLRTTAVHFTEDTILAKLKIKKTTDGTTATTLMWAVQATQIHQAVPPTYYSTWWSEVVKYNQANQNKQWKKNPLWTHWYLTKFNIFLELFKNFTFYYLFI